MSYTAGQLWSHLRAGDLRGAWATFAHAAITLAFEAWYGIRSHDYFEPHEVGVSGEHCHAYEPSDYRTLRAVVRRLAPAFGDGAFLDLGAGLGRAVIVAVAGGFRSAIGVEISPVLADAARRNVARAGRRVRGAEVEIVTGDAATYAIPPTVSVIFLFNPFGWPVLQQVLDNVAASLAAAPRSIRVVLSYGPADRLDRDWTRYPWLSRREQFAVPADQQPTVIYGN
jgi:SAM-dependent methyltransferase